jgi:hypothetical protein
VTDEISIAQQIYDLVNRKNRVASDDEVLAEMRSLVKDLPWAVEILNGEVPQNAIMPPTARKLNRLMYLADERLRAKPETVEDFPRWATHVAVFEAGRKDQLGLSDEPTGSTRKIAVQIIDGAWNLEIRGVRKPCSPAPMPGGSPHQSMLNHLR